MKIKSEKEAKCSHIMNVVYLTFSLHILANSCFPHVIKYITIEGEGWRVRGSVQLCPGMYQISTRGQDGVGKVSTDSIAVRS